MPTSSSSPRPSQTFLTSNKGKSLFVIDDFIDHWRKTTLNVTYWACQVQFTYALSAIWQYSRTELKICFFRDFSFQDCFQDFFFGIFIHYLQNECYPEKLLPLLRYWFVCNEPYIKKSPKIPLLTLYRLFRSMRWAPRNYDLESFTTFETPCIIMRREMKGYDLRDRSIHFEIDKGFIRLSRSKSL
jgi:hypothetical protein